MRCLSRNKRTFWYAHYLGKEPILVPDEEGNMVESGEYRVKYSMPLEAKGNISPAAGATHTGLFGRFDGYDRSIVMADADFPLNENSVLWVDSTPFMGEELEMLVPFDYTVSKIARGLNSVSIAISKVTTSEENIAYY